jgi:NAD(P)-dependent dehydrogenase (short-subunit alcohol dehydrogenase family)
VIEPSGQGIIMSKTNKPLIALVTGANRGLGLETSRQLAAKGVTVLMAGRDADSIGAAAAGLRAKGLTVEPVMLDVGNAAQVEAVRALIAERYGHLDILVNNAGIIADEGGFLQNNATTVSLDELRKTFEVNLFAVMQLTSTLLPLIRAAEAGRIVNLSSVIGSLGLHTTPDSWLAPFKPVAYAASKVALNMYTVCLAQALADTPIKVNSAHPGWVKTDLGGEAAPMEIVDGAKTPVALALLGPDGPSGHFIHLDDEIPW